MAMDGVEWEGFSKAAVTKRVDELIQVVVAGVWWPKARKTITAVFYLVSGGQRPLRTAAEGTNITEKEMVMMKQD